MDRDVALLMVTGLNNMKTAVQKIVTGSQNEHTAEASDNRDASNKAISFVEEKN